jgi:hypothetical protein
MTFNVLAIGQSGRLEHEAILLAASLRLSDPDFPGTLFIAEPQPGPEWQGDPRMSGRTRSLLESLGAAILPFESQAFGSDYPHGNKIEALAELPDAPFLFLDTDTLITGRLSAVPFDFAKPSASMRREGTWPKIEFYGPTHNQTWKSLYDRFELDFASSLDLSHPDEYWQRYLYFNAGWFFHESPRAFGNRFLAYAKSIRDNPPEELVCQELYPWLDQIALPLVIHSFGGGRPGLSLARSMAPPPVTTEPCRFFMPAKVTMRSRCWKLSRRIRRSAPRSAPGARSSPWSTRTRAPGRARSSTVARFPDANR